MNREVVQRNMKPRLLIVGASGFVGSRWAQAAASHFEVLRSARRPPEPSGWVSLDITDPASVRAAFDEVRPEFVTLLAALSDIDRCQREQELAEKINFTGAVNVARACARRGARLLYTSTDAVFDGTLGMYHEGDPPTPLNWYGQTKARAERAIAELVPAATIVRPSLVLGIGARCGGNSYLEKVVANLRAGNPIISPTYEYRNPIDVATLCEFFAELTTSDRATGIFHIGASDKISRYELACAIAGRLGFDAGLVVPQTEPVPGRAPRGLDDFLATDRLRSVCRTAIPTCRQVVERALDGVA
jgi:dTDP-4-dehydrorhamnose reductase